MSTTLLTAALIGTALLQGAEPSADEAQKETAAAEAPAEQAKEAPEAADAQKATDKEETEANAPQAESVDRPAASTTGEKQRVGAFWFISIGN